MKGGFTVLVSPQFERLAKRLAKQQSEFAEQFQKALSILKTDPYNQTRSHPILKLAGVQANNGQWRLRIGRLRFRYDIIERIVELKYCGLRRESTY